MNEKEFSLSPYLADLASYGKLFDELVYYCKLCSLRTLIIP